MTVRCWPVALSCCLALLTPGAAAAQQCPGRMEAAGDVGIRALRCSGPSASCAINVRTARRDVNAAADAVGGGSAPGQDVRHVFAVEPVITSVADGSTLLVGDTLVAIDGLLVTTAAGGTRLARPQLGSAATLLIRRNGSLREVRVTVTRGCGITSLTVSR